MCLRVGWFWLGCALWGGAFGFEQRRGVDCFRRAGAYRCALKRYVLKQYVLIKVRVLWILVTYSCITCCIGSGDGKRCQAGGHMRIISTGARLRLRNFNCRGMTVPKLQLI